MKSFIESREVECRKAIANSLKNLPDFCFEYFIGIENRTSALTRKNYAMDLEIFFDYLSKYKFDKNIKEITCNDLENVTATDIETFLSYLTYYEYQGKEHRNNDKGKSRKLSTIKSLFKYLFKKDKISANIASKVEAPKLYNKEIIRLEVNEVAELLNEVESPSGLTPRAFKFSKHTRERDNAILTLFLGTGIRISELVGLNIDDFNFNENAFKVTRKGGDQTVLYFPEEVKEALLCYIEKRKTLQIEESEKAMFISLQNKRITVRAVENLVKKYTRIVSPLKNISPHKLRSTFGTNLYRETGDIYLVADVLGHKDINTTKRHYAAISEDMRRQTADKVKLR